jgi:hypothetical protein
LKLDICNYKQPNNQKPLKEAESESAEEVEDDIPLAHSQPEDELVTDSRTMFSDGNPKKSGRGGEMNTEAKMSDPETYRTPPGVENAQERNNRLQKIRLGRRNGSTMRMSEGNTRYYSHSLHPGMTAL